jgi:predicted phosphohydrolase
MASQRFVCLSDTHNHHRSLTVPDGDVLVHAGDFTMNGTRGEVEEFADWLEALPHPRKVLVAGNHDRLFQERPDEARALVHFADYLEDGPLEFDGLRLWGSPWQPEFGGWAFGRPAGAAMADVWDAVEGRVDVLVTHVPPRGSMDRIHNGVDIGCAALTAALPRIAPKLHVFGHVHESRGTRMSDGRLSVNAATCDHRYRRAHEPIVVECTDDRFAVVE